MEGCECIGEAGFTGLAAGALGLVEVVGQSAEPYALNAQYLIVKNEIAAEEALKALDGKPVIASDTGAPIIHDLRCQTVWAKHAYVSVCASHW
jgi:hypothetical protein